MIKYKRILLIVLAFATVLAMSGCEPAQEPRVFYPAAYLMHPMGTIRLGMDIDEVEDTLGLDLGAGIFLPLEGRLLFDYTEPDIIVLYDENTYEALEIWIYGPGSVFNGVTIGAAYDEVLALGGDYAVEWMTDAGGGRRVISLYFNWSGEPADPYDDDISHTVSYEFNEYGVVWRIMIRDITVE